MGLSLGLYHDVRHETDHVLHASADDYRFIFGGHPDLGTGVCGKKEMKQQLHHQEELHFYWMQTGGQSKIERTRTNSDKNDKNHQYSMEYP